MFSASEHLSFVGEAPNVQPFEYSFNARHEFNTVFLHAGGVYWPCGPCHHAASLLIVAGLHLQSLCAPTSSNGLN